MTVAFLYHVPAGVMEAKAGFGNIWMVNAESFQLVPPSTVVMLRFHAPVEALYGMWICPLIVVAVTFMTPASVPFRESPDLFWKVTIVLFSWKFVPVIV